MSSNLKVNTILPSTGTNIGIGTAGGTVTIVGDVDIVDKIVHTGDTNTSIRFPSSDTITFETNGGERFRITDAASSFKNKLIIDDGSNGHLFLNNTSSENTIHSGTTGFAAYKNLVINAAQHIFKVSNTEKLRIDSSGRLLIGTTTEGAGGADELTIAGPSNTGFTIRSGNTSEGNIFFSDGTSGGDEYRGVIRYAHNGNQFELFTDGSRHIIIDSSGRVLIGTSTQFGDGLDRLMMENGNNGGRIAFGTAAGFAECIIGSVGAYWADNKKVASIAFFGGSDTTNKDDGTIRFSTSSANNLSERCRITSTGELGVNTTAPVEKLGISGNMRFVNPTGTTSRITALPSGSYNTGTTGGSAVCFQRFADGGGGSDEIFFETHWQGNRHGESMRINKYGHVKIPNQPSFNVTITTTGQINSNIGTVVFNDTTSLYNHNTGNHYNASNGRFTAPVTGKYQINARMLTNSSTTSHTIYLLRVNGNVVGYIGHNHSDYWFMESGSWVLNLSTNDYVDCYLQTHSGHGGHNYASFSGFFIG